jgi:hypothetical protein
VVDMGDDAEIPDQRRVGTTGSGCGHPRIVPSRPRFGCRGPEGVFSAVGKRIPKGNQWQTSSLRSSGTAPTKRRASATRL